MTEGGSGVRISAVNSPEGSSCIITDMLSTCVSSSITGISNNVVGSSEVFLFWGGYLFHV